VIVSDYFNSALPFHHSVPSPTPEGQHHEPTNTLGEPPPIWYNLRQIGHQDFGLLWPIVAPAFGGFRADHE
jgi:hypothetical protein